MPITGAVPNTDKSNSVRPRGKSAVGGVDPYIALGGSAGQNFLRIGPALPTVSSRGQQQRLNRRSYSTLTSGFPSSLANGAHHVDTGDVLASSGSIPVETGPEGKMQVCRSQKEREKFPDKICLDRRGLSSIPSIIGEPLLRLLSLQHNLISHLDGLQCLQLTRLVFLDVYDNQIDKISSLDKLVNLKVLLMGKNRIKRMEGLDKITKLEVLDLHGNQITSISNLSALSQLKVLNLAGNQIRIIGCSDLQGLFCLRELNLKRNRLKKLMGFGETPQLTKLFLSNNDLQTVDDISSIAKSPNLREIQIDNNPVSSAGECVSFFVSYLPNLTLLSQMQVTEQVRKAAMAWRKNKENSDSNYLDITNDSRREEVISNARTNWELLRSQSKCLTNNTPKSLKDLGLKPECDFVVTSVNKTDKSNLTRKKVDTKSVNSKLKTLKKLPSQESTSSEFFRLPPILVPLLNNISDNPNQIKRCESLSSVNPNVDSSSSSVSLQDSSESEDEIIKTNKRTNDKTHLNGCTKFNRTIDRVNRLNEKHKSEVKLKDKGKLISRKNIGKTESPVAEKVSTKAVDPNKQIEKLEVVEKLEDITAVGDTSGDNKERSDKVENSDSILEEKEAVGNNNTKAKSVENEAVSNLSVGNSNITSSSKSSSSSDNTLKTEESCRSIRSATTRNRNINHKLNHRAMTAKPKPKPAEETNASNQGREREQGGDYLIEICGRYLNIYGQGALRFIDKPWNPAKANDVTHIKFSYANFNSIVTVLNRVKQRFPNADNFIFIETNICVLAQLNALAEIQGIVSLQIDEAGNPITQKTWEKYAIFRLAHWGLKHINDNEVSDEDIIAANGEYQGLSDLVLYSLPEAPLQPLLTRLRLDGTAMASQLTPKQWLWQTDAALRSVVAKEALQWRPRGTNGQDDVNWRHKGRLHLSTMLENTCDAVVKLQQLDREWPALLVEMIRNTLMDYSQIDVYVKQKIQELNNKTDKDN